MASPPHPEYTNDYANHITWNTRFRAPRFEDVALGIACLEAIEGERDRIGLDVFAYCLMPDHLHLIIGPSPIRVGYVVRALKLAAVQNLMVAGLAHGRLWQRGYFEKGLRDTNQLRTALDYIHKNPLEEGLARDPAAYRLSSFSSWEGGADGPIALAKDKLDLY
jgi:putative transposase